MERIPHGVYTPEFRSEAVKLVDTEEQSGQLGEGFPIGETGESRLRAARADGDGNGIGAAAQRVGRSETGARPAKKCAAYFAKESR